MSKIKKPKMPHEPKKPYKPSKPAKPKEFDSFYQDPIYFGQKEFMDYEIVNDGCYEYDDYSLKAYLTLDKHKIISEAVTKFQIEHPNASDVRIDMVYGCIEYKEYGRNPKYENEIKSYEKSIKSYEQKMKKYNSEHEIYEQNYKKYLEELKIYNDLNDKYELEQTKIKLNKLEKKLKIV